MNILREDWKPVLSLQAVLVGLQYLFLEPNADDPLNKGNFNYNYFKSEINIFLFYIDAAEVLRHNRNTFQDNVKRSMAGGSIDGFQYDNVLA